MKSINSLPFQKRMKIIERADIDVVKWDQLVDRENGLVFNCSCYLDAVAENWCIYVNEEYTSGIALPYVVRLNKKKLYTPIFSRTTEWLGINCPKDLEKVLSEWFPMASIAIRGNGDLIYQEYDPTPELNTQAKRMIKKAEKCGYSIHVGKDIDSILKTIEVELPKKVKSIGSGSLSALKELVKAMDDKGVLLVKSVYDTQHKFKGGLFFIEYNDRVIYLKGGFEQQAKKEGAMYYAMHLEIQETMSKGKVFDFGGSRVQGVRNFNLNLGGKDIHYSMLNWNNSPAWYKVAHKMAKMMKG